MKHITQLTLVCMASTLFASSNALEQKLNSIQDSNIKFKCDKSYTCEAGKTPKAFLNKDGNSTLQMSFEHLKVVFDKNENMEFSSHFSILEKAKYYEVSKLSLKNEKESLSNVNIEKLTFVNKNNINTEVKNISGLEGEMLFDVTNLNMDKKILQHIQEENKKTLKELYEKIDKLDPKQADEIARVFILEEEILTKDVLRKMVKLYGQYSNLIYDDFDDFSFKAKLNTSVASKEDLNLKVDLFYKQRSSQNTVLNFKLKNVQKTLDTINKKQNGKKQKFNPFMLLVSGADVLLESIEYKVDDIQKEKKIVDKLDKNLVGTYNVSVEKIFNNVSKILLSNTNKDAITAFKDNMTSYLKLQLPKENTSYVIIKNTHNKSFMQMFQEEQRNISIIQKSLAQESMREEESFKQKEGITEENKEQNAAKLSEFRNKQRKVHNKENSKLIAASIIEYLYENFEIVKK